MIRQVSVADIRESGNVGYPRKRWTSDLYLIVGNQDEIFFGDLS
jgi:hypothetical protein